MNGEVSGVDLARVALRGAREAARKNGAGRTAKPKRRAPVSRRDGREPLGLGDAIGALIAERAWELPAAGASLRERWAQIVPELAGHVAAVGYDADSGELNVRPESNAWATKVRLEQTRLVRAANDAAGRAAVRSIRVLPPGPAPAATETSVPAAPAPATPEAAVKSRETASAGYHHALAAHQASRKATVADPAVRAVAERQLREQAREPEEHFGDGRQALEELRAKAERTTSVDASRARALQRLAAERAGLATVTPTPTPAAAPTPISRTACAAWG
jgi:Dna[CI] antecedent, DciA